MAASNAYKPLSSAEILASNPQPPEWVWGGYIAVADLFIFAAYMKVGKSTLLYPLALSVARGANFLGRPTKQGGVLLVPVEEKRIDVELRLKKLGMRNTDPIYIDPNPTQFLKGQQQIINTEAFIKSNGITLVIVDSVSFWWEGVKNENANAELTTALKPLLQLSRNTDAAVGFYSPRK